MEICDLGVYARGHCMRLPNCVKYNGSRMENRKLKITGNSTFSDFIIQKTDMPGMQNFRCPIVYNPLSAFDGVTGELTTESMEKIGNWLLNAFSLNVTFTGTTINVQNKPYKCPVSGEMHDNRTLACTHKAIRCFSYKCRSNKILYFPDDLPIQVRKDDAKIFEDALIQDQSLVNFNIKSARITFIKSPMASGKTKCILP